MAVDYTGTFLYTANRSSNDISAYKIGSSSTLTPIPGSPFTAVADPVSIALVRPRTRPIYSATEIPESGATRIGLQHHADRELTTREKLAARWRIPRPEFFQQAFIYAGGVNTGIENSRSSASNAINNNGQVWATMYLTPPFSGEPPPHAFIYNSSDGSTVYLDIASCREGERRISHQQRGRHHGVPFHWAVHR